MKQSNKIRVAVLYGGRSAEHEVSVRSAENVIQYLDTSRFDIIPIGIDKKGSWFLGQEVFVKSLEHNQVLSLHNNHQAWFIPESIGNPIDHVPTARSSKELSTKHTNGAAEFDVIFPVMHGTLCEDGTLQGLLEMANLPYVGCGVLSSAINMDKDVSKRLAMNAGIHVAPYIVVKHDQWQLRANHIYQQVEKLSYPVFVKPANTGSSIGINKVKSKDQLSVAIEEAFRFDTKIVIEKALNVLELEVAVLESLEADSDPIVSVVGEIKPRHEFYSYDAKYLDEDGAELLIPAPIAEDIKQQAQLVAKTLFKALECEGMARVDLFYDKDTNEIYFNEVNTIPGFTQISMYPKLMAASGVSYPELLTHLVELAMKRHHKKSQLIRSYAD
jgi:D-alanine-D-alanine ligase